MTYAAALRFAGREGLVVAVEAKFVCWEVAVTSVAVLGCTLS
jgi:hypothetical protein